MTWNITGAVHDSAALLSAADGVLRLFSTYASALSDVPVADRLRGELADATDAFRAADTEWRDSRLDIGQAQARVEQTEAAVRAAYAALRSRIALARAHNLAEPIGRFTQATPPAGKVPQGGLFIAARDLIGIAQRCPTALSLVGVGPAHLESLRSISERLADELAERVAETSEHMGVSERREVARDALLPVLRAAVELLQVVLPPQGLGELESIGAQCFPNVSRSSSLPEDDGGGDGEDAG
jgi:hypothetical protein